MSRWALPHRRTQTIYINKRLLKCNRIHSVACGTLCRSGARSHKNNPQFTPAILHKMSLRSICARTFCVGSQSKLLIIWAPRLRYRSSSLEEQAQKKSCHPIEHSLMPTLTFAPALVAGEFGCEEI